jgi:FRG domain
MTHEPPATPDSTKLFEEVELATAWELLDQLAPHRSSLWMEGRRSEEHRWIFRGQRDARWGLVPSALRKGALLKFARHQVEADEAQLPIDTYQPLPLDTQLQFEQGLVNKFVIGVDRQGLAVPGDRPDLRDYYRAVDHSPQCFPPVEQRWMFGLAQHYGIPTRLLDWSHDPRVAAYFACVEIAKAQAEAKVTPERFAVWALSQDFVERVAREWEPGISIVTVPTVSNPNLRAQQGLFTLVEHREHTMPHIPAIDELIHGKEVSPREWRKGPPLWKFSVPAPEAGVLLRLLAYQNVTAAHIYHGHEAIVKAIHEVAWHR